MTDTTPEAARETVRHERLVRPGQSLVLIDRIESLADQVERLTAELAGFARSIDLLNAEVLSVEVERDELRAKLAETQKNYAMMLILEAELRAKLAALEKQEPVAYVVAINNTLSVTMPVAQMDLLMTKHNAPLYLSAGAKE